MFESRNEGLGSSVAACVLTLADLALLLDVPGVQSGSLLVLHGRALVEVLGQVGLVEACGLHHLSLREVVLLHVTFYHFCNMPWVPPVRQKQLLHVYLPTLYSCVFYLKFPSYFHQLNSL